VVGSQGLGGWGLGNWVGDGDWGLGVWVRSWSRAERLSREFGRGVGRQGVGSWGLGWLGMGLGLEVGGGWSGVGGCSSGIMVEGRGRGLGADVECWWLELGLRVFGLEIEVSEAGGCRLGVGSWRLGDTGS
jgi:hypothetical protein